jgi:hypothetical protein
MLVATGGLAVAISLFLLIGFLSPPSWEFLLSRHRIESGSIEATLESHRSGVTRSIVNRFDGDNFQSIEVPLDDHPALQAGRLRPAEDRLTRLDGQYHVNRGDYLSSSLYEVRPEGLPQWDLRTAGLLPFLHFSTLEMGQLAEQSLIQRMREQGQWSSSEEGPLRRIEVRFEGEQGPATMTWWLDSQRGDQIVRSEYAVNGETRARAEIELSRRGEDWTPAVIRFDRQREADGVWSPEATLAIHEFRRESPGTRPLTLLDAGVDVGTNVSRVLADGQVDTFSGTPHPRLWTSDGGFEIADWRQIAREFQSGARERGANFARSLRLARLEERTRPELGSLPDQRTFVQQFIAVYRLDAEQAQRAWTLHGHAVARAEAYLQRRGPQLDVIARLRKRLIEGASSTDAEAQMPELERLASELGSHLREVVDPVNDIYRSVLTEKLYRLPTRTQLSSADDKRFRQIWGVDPTPSTTPSPAEGG